ncbi:DUF6716 putative glycosyltransferase [Populibacterium corticicola]|uniref:DUF6716 putative glycosyltransferase n=1 Tax=Populibacterium corticicola TaxID=1812826 RepID=A0ABW5XEP8_9MICO
MTVSNSHATSPILVSPPTRTVKVAAVADSDSYVKWAAATLEQLGSDFTTTLQVVRTAIAPSEAQIEAAVAGTRFERNLGGLSPQRISKTIESLREDAPDVVLLAGTGPTIEIIAAMTQRFARRPALISGIPGMALPARLKGIEFRAQGHAMIVHSHREAHEFGALLAERGVSQRLVVSHLPFLPPITSPHAHTPITSIVFTPQALVPSAPTSRSEILRALHETATKHPQIDVIVKVRALAGEQQTHNERFPYDALWQELCASDPTLDPGALRFATGPLINYLVPGSAHVTVSSTAALESMAAGLPTLILDDFGLNERLLNSVYANSGCIGSLADVTAVRFRLPEHEWMVQNYFHPEPSQLPDSLRLLADQSRNGTLPLNRPLNWRRRRRRLMRNYLRATLPPVLLQQLGRTRLRLRRLLRGGR